MLQAAVGVCGLPRSASVIETSIRGHAAKEFLMGTILLIILILLLLGGLPAWPHARDWGYGPSGLVGVLLVILLVLLILRVLPWGF
jgi:hypothetical protein